jgi:hypothetical protein
LSRGKYCRIIVGHAKSMTYLIPRSHRVFY